MPKTAAMWQKQAAVQWLQWKKKMKMGLEDWSWKGRDNRVHIYFSSWYKCNSGPNGPFSALTHANALIWNAATAHHTNGVNLHFYVICYKIDNPLVWAWQAEHKVRRNIHTWFLFTSGPFISPLILSWAWHWNGCVLSTERADFGMYHTVFFFFFFFAPPKEWIRNDEWHGSLMIL